MTLPPHIDIYGRKVPVIETDLTVKGLDGEYCYEKRTIYVEKTLKYKDKKSTLFHESLHALFHRTSLNQAQMSEDLEELTINHVENWLAECPQFELRLRKAVK